MSEEKQGEHETCTSSPIATELGYHPEHLPANILNELHKKFTGTNISEDPATARLQREIALAKDKRLRK